VVSMSRLRCSGAKSITVDEVTSLRVCAECVKLRRVAGQRSRDHFFGKSKRGQPMASPLLRSAVPLISSSACRQFIGPLIVRARPSPVTRGAAGCRPIGSGKWPRRTNPIPGRRRWRRVRQCAARDCTCRVSPAIARRRSDRSHRLRALSAGTCFPKSLSTSRSCLGSASALRPLVARNWVRT
jgi:hypothetical protein